MIKAATVLPSDPLYRDHHAFIYSVAGVLFLGTPHAGSRFANWGESWAKISAGFGFGANIELMKLLKPLTVESTTGLLEDLHIDFQRIKDEDFLTDLQAYYFWETKSEKLMVSSNYRLVQL